MCKGSALLSQNFWCHATDSWAGPEGVRLRESWLYTVSQNLCKSGVRTNSGEQTISFLVSVLWPDIRILLLIWEISMPGNFLSRNRKLHLSPWLNQHISFLFFYCIFFRWKCVERSVHSRRQVAATRRCDKSLRVYWVIFVKIFVAATEFFRRN